MRKNIFNEKWIREFHEMVRKEQAQAASSKRQASSRKRSKRQASSFKLQASIKNSGKIQAPSTKLQAPSPGRRVP